MDFHKDYYTILEISNKASKEEVKAAYRKLALRYHPDRYQGDKIAEEKMKLINEAYEVLYNDINRHIYDEYKSAEERINKQEEEEKRKARANQAKENKNNHTYSKKTIIRTEKRVYVKGNIKVKYWADQEDEIDLLIMREINFKITPNEAEAVITDSDIHAFKAPLNYSKAYSSSELFKAPIPQPVRCKIVSDLGEEYYNLALNDIKIIDPKLTDITKYEKQSLGTLSGVFYAFVIRIEEEEVEEWVTECFGETGLIETKSEDGVDYVRKEYYHKDCSKYWGPWEPIRKAKPSGTSVKTPAFQASQLDGCFQYWWIPLLLVFLIAFPQLILSLLAIALVLFLLSLGASVLGRIMPVIGLVFLVAMFYSAFNCGNVKTISYKRKTTNTYDSVGSTRNTVIQDTVSKTKDKVDSGDVLISHFVRWKDYDSIPYSVTLSVLASSVKSSAIFRNEEQVPLYSTNLGEVYRDLDQEDRAKLSYVYAAFDSIRSANNMKDLDFSKMMVSCIQSIPYFLILTKDCDPNQTDDPFTANFLEQCTAECCVGNTKFGLRSPTEFLSDLKGDCDTRALFLYSLFKHYGINIALLTSEYYRHALIAVNYDHDKRTRGLAINIHGRNYYLWETTNTGFRPGEISPDQMDLSNWTIALLNEK